MTRIQWVIGIGTGIALAIAAAMNAQPAPDTTIDTTADNGYPAPVMGYPAPGGRVDEESMLTPTYWPGEQQFPPLHMPTSAPTMTPEP